MALLYEAKSIEAAWEGIVLDHGRVGDGAFLEFTPVGDLSEISFSSDGEMGISKLSPQGAVITLTLKQTAPLNKKLAEIAAEQTKRGVRPKVGTFYCIDLLGVSSNFVARNATLTGRPTQSFAGTMGEQTWTWTCESFIDTSNIDKVTATISLWI
jgi:hypothetical protein